MSEQTPGISAVPDEFLNVLLIELRARGYRAEGSFEVLATVVSGVGAFGLRFNPAPRRRFVVSKVNGLDLSPLRKHDLDDRAEPDDAEFMSWLVELIEATALRPE